MIVIFRPQAVEDVLEAAAWYEAHAPGLAEQLIDEILAATRRAQENPGLFRIVRRDGMFGALLQSVCNRLLASSRPLNRELFLDRMK
jgi:plasmid stabilization system protein ParE